MYLRERLSRIRVGHFVEIGPGGGEITALLLSIGWTGMAYDADGTTVEVLNKRFAREIARRRLVTVNSDYLAASVRADSDLVISCMVIEHMDDEEELAFMAKAAQNVRSGGRMIGIVPSSPRHWGIEDNIAGHYRRYTRSSIKALATASGWTLTHTASLTFPISNALLPFSNYLVRRTEAGKLSLSQCARTMQSGRRKVHFKTRFPPILGLVLNRFFLYPLHAIQKSFSSSERALVLYFEAEPAHIDRL
jgi:cyclopropane fatty-acyl-phospholipid synthase-like methyltransferase